MISLSPTSMRGNSPCSIISNINICAHTADSNGIANCRQKVERMEPSRGRSDDSNCVEDINCHTSKPTDPEDNKWYNAFSSIILHSIPHFASYKLISYDIHLKVTNLPIGCSAARLRIFFVISFFWCSEDRVNCSRSYHSEY